MKKPIIVLSLTIVASGAIYGQEVVGVGTVPSASQPWNQTLPFENFSLAPQDFELKD